MNDDALRILRCPVTRSELRRALPEEIAAGNERITAAPAGQTAPGDVASQPIVDALVSGDGRHLYPIQDGIVLLLRDLAVDLAGDHPGDHSGVKALGPVKASVRAFYDELGWTRGDDETFADAQIFEDLRPVSAEYVRRCHLRVNRYLNPRGTYLLDAGSGPIQFPEYLTYSAGYERRICVDFSFVALRQARRALGDKGLYVLADVTELPLGDATVDGAVSLHTIYHVPREEQETAFHELYRVLTPGGRAAVVYSWGDPWSMRTLHAPLAVRRWGMRAQAALRSRIKAGNRADDPTDRALYFEPHDHKWFTGRNWEFDYRVSVWRTVSVSVLKIYAHERLAGRRLLRALYRLEERYPHVFGRVGQYPLIAIEKRREPGGGPTD